MLTRLIQIALLLTLPLLLTSSVAAGPGYEPTRRYSSVYQSIRLSDDRHHQEAALALPYTATEISSVLSGDYTPLYDQGIDEQLEVFSEIGRIELAVSQAETLDTLRSTVTTQQLGSDVLYSGQPGGESDYDLLYELAKLGKLLFDEDGASHQPLVTSPTTPQPLDPPCADSFCVSTSTYSKRQAVNPAPSAAADSTAVAPLLDGILEDLDQILAHSLLIHTFPNQSFSITTSHDANLSASKNMDQLVHFIPKPVSFSDESTTTETPESTAALDLADFHQRTAFLSSLSEQQLATSDYWAYRQQVDAAALALAQPLTDLSQEQDVVGQQLALMADHFDRLATTMESIADLTQQIWAKK